MTTYIYFVKCPGCEDEHFDFFDEAKEFALGCLSQKPIITQTEVCRNDFGECTDSADLGTVWSWEDMMKDTESKADDSCSHVLCKADLEDIASEFDAIDNSVDFEIDEVSEDSTGEDLEEWISTSSQGPYVIKVKNNADGYNYEGNGGRSLVRIDSDKLSVFNSYDAAMKAKMGYKNPKSVEIVLLADEQKLVECRKPIPEGMTIEQLVEEMEENEDTVECTWCEDLFDKSECRYEVDLGWLCSRCEMAIKSRGETLTFRENNYWDFLDEDLEDTRTLADLVKDSINHLTNDLGKDPWADDFADDVIKDIQNNYDSYVPEDIEHYNHWCGTVASEVSRQLNNPDNLTEASLSDIAAAANSEFGTSWDDDYLLDMAGVDDDLRSIDSFGDTLPKLPKTSKSGELSPEKIAEREAKAAEHERQKNMRFAQRYVAKYGAERYNTQYPVRRQNWKQEWPYYDEATGEFVEGERRDELVKKFEDEQHAKRMAEYEERQNQPRWYIQTRYNNKWHNLMNTTATTKEDAESWALDYMKNLEAERRAAGGRFDWKETDIRVVAGKGPGPGELQRFEEDFDPEELHDLGNTYDGGYPNETPEISNSHLKFCPECGTENTFDIETGVCLKCGFIV